MAKNIDNIDVAISEIPNGYLTLKEAAERTEYTPDYIGQLIRSGKIEGKQVYSNVAWVASEASLRGYLEQKGKEVRMGTESRATSYELSAFVRPLLYGVIIVSTALLIVLFHILSITLDRALAGAVKDDSATHIEVSNQGVVYTD
jgi:hypothetical protein